MTAKTKLSYRIISAILSVVFVLSIFPLYALLAFAAEGNLKRYADPSTMNDWTDYFYRDIDDFDTSNAGGIWTDKTVLTSKDALELLGIQGISDPGDRGFLTVLSAIGSNMTITGESKVPTDTIIVLDTSGSMNASNNNVAAQLVEATNASIRALLSANENNRVGVVFYANNNVVGLPLGRYTTTDSQGRFFDYTTSSRYEYMTLNDAVRIEGTENSPDYVSRVIYDGTFTQGGINLAKNQLLAVEDKSVSVGNSNVKRKPVMVLLSDGAPTRATTAFSTGTTYQDGFGDGSSPVSTGVAFATQLTAASAKQQIEAHYNNDSLFYTLGVGINKISNENDKNIANYVLNPSVLDTSEQANIIRERWSAYNTAAVNDYVQTTSRSNYNRVRKINATLDQYYVDGYFNTANYGDNLQNALIQAFKDVVADIEEQTAYYPTLIKGGEAQLSGYISFVDKLGRYMNISDIKGLIIGGKLYSGVNMASAFNNEALGTPEVPTKLGDNLIWSINERLGIAPEVSRSLINSAYNAGQLYYNGDSDYSNYFGWYSDAENKFIGFASEDTVVPSNAVYVNRSYIFLGEYDEQTNSYDERAMYITVRVRETILTGEQEVNFSIPASIIPTVTYSVALDENGVVENVQTNASETSPIRLVYETELDSRINKWTVGEIIDDKYTSYVSDGGNNYTLNDDGSVNFYNNKWDFDQNTGYGNDNTYAYYNPAYENDRHYFQENSYIYTRSLSGYSLYESENTQPSGDGYYYGTTVYYKDGSNVGKRTEYTELKSDILLASKRDNKNNWYIPSSYVRVGVYSGNAIAKTDNESSTLLQWAVPFADYSKGDGKASYENDGHYLIVATTLGNNGKITLEAESGVKIKKVLDEGVTADESKYFNFKVLSSNKSAVAREAYKILADGSGQTVWVNFNAQGEATVSLKANETLYIGDMQSGETVTVTETVDTEYKLKSLTVDGTADGDGVAEISLGDVDMIETVFTNTARAKGQISVTKRITHPYSNYTLPNKTFTVNLTMTFDGKPLALYTLDSVNGTDENGVCTITLANNETKTVSGIPEGTVVTVEEVLADGFTPSYTENIGTANDAVVEASTTPVTVVITNNYVPDNADGSVIKVSGTKSYDSSDNRVWEIGDKYIFVLQQYKNNTWTDMQTKVVEISDGDSRIGTNTPVGFDFTDAFSSIEYSYPGTYYYRVIEKDTSMAGVNIDTRNHRFEVTVTDSEMNGKLVISSVKASEGNENTVSVAKSESNYNVKAEFINGYNAEDTFVNIEIHKSIFNPTQSPVGEKLDGFKFQIAEVDNPTDEVNWETAEVISGSTTSTGVLKHQIQYVLSDLGDSQSIIKFYKIREIDATQGDKEKGWTYDTSEKIVVVEIENNHTMGALVANAYLYGDEPSAISSSVVVDVQNQYKPDSDEIVLIDHEPTTINPDFVKKLLSGRDMTVGEFSFTIYDEDKGAVYTTGTNEAAKAGEKAAVNFLKNLSFDTVGEFRYSVYETDNGINGIEFDNTKWYFTVTVTDSGEGYLEAVLTFDSGEGSITEAVFENTYDAADKAYSITATKVLKGQEITANRFSFYIQPCDENGTVTAKTQPTLVYNDESYVNNITFPSFTYTAAGTYYWLIWENVPVDENLGITYDTSKYMVTVTVTDNTADAVLEIEPLTYQKMAGGESTWVSASAIEFNNEYKAAPTSLTILGHKSVEGDIPLQRGDYSFALYNSNANWDELELYDSSNNGEIAEYLIGHFEFKPLNFTQVGTYYYLVKEIIPTGNGAIGGMDYDETLYYITVTVKDNGRGNLLSNVNIITDSNNPTDEISFINEYSVIEGTSVEFNGKKDLTKGEGTNVDFSDFTFTFEMYNANASYEKLGEPITVNADENGDYSFTREYVPAELGNTYYYVIVEKNNGAGGITYSSAEYRIKVEVLDTVKDGVLETNVTIVDKDNNPVESDEVDFINNYAIVEFASLELEGKKNLEGRDIVANEFKFDLYSVDSDLQNAQLLKSAYAGADGTFSIVDIPLSQVGVFKFILKEDVSLSIARPNVIYDKTEYLITVTVVDDKDGTLSISDTKYELISEPVITEVEVLEFNNIYQEPENDNPPTSDSSTTLIAFTMLISTIGLFAIILSNKKKVQK